MKTGISSTASRRLALLTLSGIVIGAAACSGGATASAAGGPAWTLVSDLSAFDSATVADVTSNGSGFVAVGSVTKGGVQNGAIWSSADGLAWQAVAVDAPKATFVRVGHGPNGLVATGNTCPGTGECPGSTFWSSKDGTTWTQHGSDLCCWTLALASGNFGIVGVGSDFTHFDQTSQPDVAAFVSQDGTSWKRSTSNASLKGASMAAVAAGGPGVVALGSGGSSLQAWTSPDGVTWTVALTGDTLKTGEVRDMIARGSTLVAVGRDGSDAVAWTTADGLSWSRTPSGAAPLQGALMERLAATTGSLIAVGKDNSGAGAIWTSTDGLAWTKASSVPGQPADLSAVAASGGTAVAFGTANNGSVVILRQQVRAG